MEVIIDALATRAITDSSAMSDALRVTEGDERDFDIDQLAGLVTALIESLTSRRDDMRARYALILELHDAHDLRAKLTADSDVHATSRRIGASTLAMAGLPHTDERVDELLALADSLVFHRTAINPNAPVAPIITAYLRGIAPR